jgi:hypothetical protein
MVFGKKAMKMVHKLFFGQDEEVEASGKAEDNRSSGILCSCLPVRNHRTVGREIDVCRGENEREPVNVNIKTDSVSYVPSTPCIQRRFKVLIDPQVEYIQHSSYPASFK